MDSAIHRINIVRFSTSTVKMKIMSYDCFSILYPIQMNEFIWIVWMCLVLNVLTVHIGVIWMNGIIPESRSTTDSDCTMCTYVQALLLIYMMKITSTMQRIKLPAKIKKTQPTKNDAATTMHAAWMMFTQHRKIKSMIGRQKWNKWTKRNFIR